LKEKQKRRIKSIRLLLSLKMNFLPENRNYLFASILRFVLIACAIMIATTANANNVTIIFYPFFNLSNSTARAVFNILITFLLTVAKVRNLFCVR